MIVGIQALQFSLFYITAKKIRKYLAVDTSNKLVGTRLC